MTISNPARPGDQETVRAHPLDPLSRAEIELAAGMIHADIRAPAALRFVSVELCEPPKAQVLGYEPGAVCERRASAVLLDRELGSCVEVLVSLTRAEIDSWRVIKGVQPAITPDEVAECQRVARNCPEFLAAIAKRGVTDPDLVMLDPWSAGHYGDEPSADAGRRLVRALAYARAEPQDNGYARPIENLLTIIDLNLMEVVRVEDHGVVPLPPEPANWTSRYVPPDRPAPSPLHIAQPQGPGFSVNGQEIRWQGWRFRIGFNAREGLVLHTVGFEDGDLLRPILYRAAVSEMLVPYGDPGVTSYRKNAFDVGEYGIGITANSLALGCDCLGEIFYLDAHMVDSAGSPRTIKNAVCLHEEDDGILWKHTDWRTGAVEVRRSRRLVASFITTVGIYEYGFYWIFGQDASLELLIKLTGIPSATAMAPGDEPKHGVEVAPQLSATLHQHFFNVRLDLEIDGTGNSVREVDAVALPPGKDNPHLNAFVARPRPLESEAVARRRCNPSTSRYWQIVNPGSRNRNGQSAGYRLVPGENAIPLAHGAASVSRRAGFLQHHFWVTAYDPSQRFAAGEFPNQRAGDDGLATWTDLDRPLVNTDLVVWYTFGHTHVPRAEEWPVMPVHKIGFMLKPDGFFDRNPALGIPRDGAVAGREESGEESVTGAGQPGCH
jgi:primary-amine oxidase